MNIFLTILNADIMYPYVLENSILLKLFFERINRKKVPEKKRSKPIEIQIDGFIELSNLIILS